MRIVLSSRSGILGAPYRVLIPCVLVSASISAAIFLELGRRLRRRVQNVFGIFPAHLIPWLVLGLILLLIGYLAYENGYKPKANRDPVEQPQ
ncbi:MAG TPA: hypothetical protein VN965_07600 [Candidatus Dormibacteraeota bacterium]|nr:hypothetical protein [Candidatus Dormibacteraeota bacterium]